jgi:hypothetical protein
MIRYPGYDWLIFNLRIPHCHRNFLVVFLENLGFPKLVELTKNYEATFLN